MKKAVVIIALTLFFLIPNAAFARSGCCSHHSGVCGCGCCDGTPLSATCAPYYPECSGGGTVEETNQPVYVPPVVITQMPILTSTPTNSPTPTNTPTLTPTNSPSPTLTPTNTPTPSIKVLITSEPLKSKPATNQTRPLKWWELSPVTLFFGVIFGWK